MSIQIYLCVAYISIHNKGQRDGVSCQKMKCYRGVCYLFNNDTNLKIVIGFIYLYFKYQSIDLKMASHFQFLMVYTRQKILAVWDKASEVCWIGIYMLFHQVCFSYVNIWFKK